MSKLNRQSKIVYEDRPGNAPTVSSETKSKCSVSRLICIQLLILFVLLVLAAIIIPIVVIVLENQSTTSPCSRTFSESFTVGQNSPAQCASWQTFTTGLNCASYSMMRIYGTNDQTGLTVSNSLVATTLAVALRQNTTVTINLNGVTWRVGGCGGFEISATGTICSCASGYTIRPCNGAPSWGGISGTTCSAPSQTMSLHFE